jgi:hypothetical protein
MTINIDTIDNIYLIDVYKNEIHFINDTIKIIIDYYNYNMCDNNIDINSMVCLTNELLLVYISKNNNDSIDNHKKAYDFILLSNSVSFWIIYKFITNAETITTYILKSYIFFDHDVILKKELDILNAINYNIYNIIIKKNEISL